MIPYHRYAGPRSVKGGQKGARGALAKHVKYLQYRSMGEHESRDTRAIFNRDSDGMSRRGVLDDVMNHMWNNVYYHKLMVSPADDERVEDWRIWTRQVMRDLEQKQGKELHWYAIQHNNTDNPHVHIVIAGATEQQGGRLGQVRIDKTDYALVKESGRAHSAYELDRMVRELVHREEQAERVFDQAWSRFLTGQSSQIAQRKEAVSLELGKDGAQWREGQQVDREREQLYARQEAEQREQEEQRQKQRGYGRGR